MTEELYVESSGKGFPIVLLHGWAMHGGIWDECVPFLSSRGRLVRPDLPGHGRSPPLTAQSDIDEMVAVVARHCPRKMILLGWSLGGLIAIRLARRLPQRVRQLILVASTPRFVTASDWPCAVEPTVLEDFGRSLTDDYRRTVRDFLSLQVRGDERATELLRALKERVFAHGQPNARALRQGLELLAATDLRDDLPALQSPTLVISGDRDRITPPEAGRRMAELIPGCRFLEIQGAAHAPFLSHADEFLSGVAQFMDRSS